MPQFSKYSDAILTAFRLNTKPQDIVQKKQEILDSVFDYYHIQPGSLLFVGFNPALMAAEEYADAIFVTKVSESVRDYLDSQGVKYTYVDDVNDKKFDCVIAMDEYFTFSDSHEKQKSEIEKLCAITNQVLITTVKDYKNQEYKDREASQPAVIRGHDTINTFIEIHDWDFKVKNAWKTDVYHLCGADAEYLGRYDRRTVFFKQMAKFSLDAGADDFRVHKNLMYKSVLKKNYEHVITVYFKKWLMDISKQLESIVENIVDEIHSQVQDQALAGISKFIEDRLSTYDFDSKIAGYADIHVAARVAELQFDTKSIRSELEQAGEQAVADLKADVTREVIADIKNQLAAIDVRTLVKSMVKETVNGYIDNLNFKEGTIPGEAINWGNAIISGDNIAGGVIKSFGSTGIDDRASQCQVTIMDTNVVIETPILTTGIEVRGDAKITGDLLIEGQIPTDTEVFKQLTEHASIAVREKLNTELFQGFSDLIYNEIKEKGIEFDAVRIGGQTVLTNNALGNSVTQSVLRKVGELDELQVRGEALLSQTLYANQKKVGINTLEPSAALSVWDEEVEINMGKQRLNQAYIGTKRPAEVILGANGKEAVLIDIDGAVTINDFRLGALPISTASIKPNWSGRAGEIVFNDSPGIGKPIGWVCLEKDRWANFGIISE